MNYLEKYSYCPDETGIRKGIDSLYSDLSVYNNSEVLKECFSFIDLTSLSSNDSERSIAAFVEKLNRFGEEYPQWPLPASLCVFSNFASLVSSRKHSPSVHTTVVSACFPSSQTFVEVKEAECRMAVENGADEVDIVLPLGKFADGEYDAVSDEIGRMRKAVDAAAANRKITLKVILETGILVSADAIATASFIAMEAGADFIKTSTGKTGTGATPFAAWVMCECIKAYYKFAGRRVGFKPAGGISSINDVLGYYATVAHILGKEWLSPLYFRFGTSRIANSILSEVEGKEIQFF